LAETVVLHAVPRTVTGKKVKQIRRQGWIPLVVYGPEHEPAPYQADDFEMGRVLASAGMTSLVSLEVEGQKTPFSVLVRDIQRDVLSDALLHVDLYRVSMTRKITTEVPIELVGHASGLTADTMLLTLLDRVEIECLPGDLVSSLELDLGSLKHVDDVLTVSHLAVPAGIAVLAEGNEPIVRLAHATRLPEGEEEEGLFPIAADAVEVIGRGKTEEEEK